MWNSRRNRDWNRTSSKKTIRNHLTLSMHKTETDSEPMGFNLDSCHCLQEDVNCDEVYPGIYIGDAVRATNKSYLKDKAITHLINTAEGKGFGLVDTNQYYYIDSPIKYLGLPLTDWHTTETSKYFYTIAAFIDEGVSNGGKVFVHCMAGISRSVTCVLAYLMIKKGISAIDAIQTVRKSRYIKPNDGFLHQLVHLDTQLHGNYTLWRAQ